ncbi:two-component response regulator ARR12-like [Rhodamnia argentea]|uniref:Two-component response regulator ARR12-like n=1 Tax=Rhodamnia argentea TaxID=178133 RepID=A0A8B8QPT0_9MYRT|nr:two-component response regulator ARR12-like [Rhodamnia argentea]
MAIDGNLVSLSVLIAMLRKCMYGVSTYAKATEALQVLRRYKYDFDIVVAAMVGIDMDSLDLLKIIDSELGIPVIVASASGDQQVITKAIFHGARDILKKPVRI